MTRALCEHCGELAGFPFRDERLRITCLCSTCAHQHVLWKAAYEQLVILTREVVIGWTRTWGSVEGIASLPEIFEWVSDDLEAERLAGEWNA